MKKITYLDHAATTPVRPEVLKAMLPWFSENYGNPSSLYSIGRESKGTIAKAREQLARLVNAPADRVFFTGCGTEADNWAVKGTAFANSGKGKHIIVSAIEHHAVLDTAESLHGLGFDITILPVDRYGLVDPDTLKHAIRDDTILVSVMHANNEVGTIEPAAEISAICRDKGVIFHVDAVQTVGNYPVDVDELGCDLLSASGHKLYGPKGVGALFIRKGTRIKSRLNGGGQERNRRAGTENIAGIVGFGKAAELAIEEMRGAMERSSKLRDRLRDGILERIPDVRLNGHPTKQLPNNLNVSIEGIEGESILLRLDMKGICASTGSACTTGNLEPSHVLLAMGIPHEICHGSQRFTLGRATTQEEIDYTVDALEEIVKTLRAMSPMYQRNA